MSSDIRRQADTGIYTAEGMVAGSRAAKLTQARGQQVADYAKSRKRIEEEAKSVTVAHIDAKFSKTVASGVEDFKAKTVGLVTASEFKRAREIVAQRELEERMKTEERDRYLKARKSEELKKKRKAANVSFSVDELEGEEELPSPVPAPSPVTTARAVAPALKSLAAAVGRPASSPGAAGGAGGSFGGAGAGAGAVVVPKRSKFGKDPTVETGFLPDAEREAREAAIREKLKLEWLAQQEIVKLEKLTITYSYWDGSGHRRDIDVPKGNTVGKFLESVRLDIMSEFPELRAVSSENLLYVKEDLIIPHHFTFYELILSKARGKSGPLFSFDVHDDVRITHDATIEKDESHPGKIVERHWYERNKHIFPASRWEVFDPQVKRDKYTVHGGEIR